MNCNGISTTCCSLWTAIEQAAASRSAPFLVYQESNLFIRALRDHLRNDIGEILIDNETVYNDAREFMQQVMPHNLTKLKLYTDQVPLFNRYQIESQIESAFARTVHLPSGGAVVFDHTEALLIDRHQLRPRHQGFGYRGNRLQHKHGVRQRDRPAVALCVTWVDSS